MPDQPPETLPGRVRVLEIGMEGLKGQVSGLQAQLTTFGGELSGLRTETRTLLGTVSTQLSGVLRQLDEDRGRRIAAEEFERKAQKRDEAMGAWLRALLPFVIGIAVAFMTMFIDGRLSR